MGNIKNQSFGAGWHTIPEYNFPHRQQGFTLVEVVMVVAIFGVVIAAGASILFAGTKLYQSGIKQQDSLVKMVSFFNMLKRYLNNASVIRAAGATGEYIDFQIPTEVGGAMLNSLGTPFWGDGTTLDQKVRLRFVAAIDSDGNVLPKIKEVDEKRDINGDGDQDDEFERGYVEKVSVKADDTVVLGSNEAISYNDWLLREADNNIQTKFFSRVNAIDVEDMLSGQNVKITAITLERHATGPIPMRRTLRIAPVNQNAAK